MAGWLRKRDPPSGPLHLNDGPRRDLALLLPLPINDPGYPVAITQRVMIDGDVGRAPIIIDHEE